MEIFNKYNIIPNDMNLFLTAFTHSSYCNENKGVESYERLEFLGDKVIDFVVSEYLYKSEHIEEGEMTKIRAAHVCEDALYEYALFLNKLSLTIKDLFLNELLLFWTQNGDFPIL